MEDHSARRRARDAPSDLVDELRPGLALVRVPIPDNPLDHVFVYVLDLGNGPVLVDAGWPSDVSLRGLEDGLAGIGLALPDVRGVLVTHLHPDHFGLASVVRDRSDAWIGMHPADAQHVSTRYGDIERLIAETTTWMVHCGVPPDRLPELRDASSFVAGLVETVDPDRSLVDGDHVRGGGWDLTVVHTPGHTAGHVCLVDERAGVVFTGDHVLPRISPNVAFNPQSSKQPLADYTASLRRIAAFQNAGTTLHALPAHERPFDRLPDRVDELHTHHEERLVEVRDFLGYGTSTVWETALGVTWSRPWHQIPHHMRRAALGETFAHLLELERRGLVTRAQQESQAYTWAANAPGAAR